MTTPAIEKYRPVFLATLALVALPFALSALGLSLNTEIQVVALAIVIVLGFLATVGWLYVAEPHSDNRATNPRSFSLAICRSVLRSLYTGIRIESFMPVSPPGLFVRLSFLVFPCLTQLG